jgi:hypothetical protein
MIIFERSRTKSVSPREWRTRGELHGKGGEDDDQRERRPSWVEDDSLMGCTLSSRNAKPERWRELRKTLETSTSEATSLYMMP